jgi:quinol---cytochrome c reductase iron-sulfur subunit, bacillus type
MAEIATRRRFLSRLSLGLSGLAGAVVAVPIVAYLLSPLINPAPRVWRDVGRVDDFKVGETKEVAVVDPSSLPWAGQTALTAVWVRRTGEVAFTAFAVNCTHLGCPVNWQAGASLFLCPCHGGVYYADGRVAGGPPPKPLPRYDVRVQDGVVQVQTQPLPVTS